MFTGLVQYVGAVAAIERVPFGAVLEIDPRGWTHVPEEGASIAVDGCCLTVARTGPGTLRFDVVRQTLEVTAIGDLRPGDLVNLEHAATPSSFLGGHVVQGHVDGVAVVRDVRREAGERRLRLAPPPESLDAIVERGSVALAGVSLTVARVDGPHFEVALIPATLERTTLGRVEPGARLNLETDYLAKTVVHWLARRAPPPAPGPRACTRG